MSKQEQVSFFCWQCGLELEDLIFPISRRDECPACRAELHVCRFCKLYDPRVSGSCREDRAEAVTNKITANFCDYYVLNPNAYSSKQESGQQSALSAAEALFGGAGQGEQSSEDDENTTTIDAKVEQAKDELKKLFGDD